MQDGFNRPHSGSSVLGVLHDPLAHNLQVVVIELSKTLSTTGVSLEFPVLFVKL
jgi:hypothetical protein